MIKLKKPKIKTSSYWVYREIIDYIEQKYNVETRDYIPKNGFSSEQLEGRSEFDKKRDQKPHLDFWSWIIDRYDIHNGSFFTLLYDDDSPDWVREILKMIFDEFETECAEIEMYVSW